MGSQEEVVMFMEKGPVKSNYCLPLLVVQPRMAIMSTLGAVTLGNIDLNALALHHDQAGIDSLDFSNQLLLIDGSFLRLLDHV